MSMIDEDDFFKDSSMSFGDHLEELRTCLIKSVIGLAVGFLIGLYFGGTVVQIIQSPLRGALQKHYQKRLDKDIHAHLDNFYERGYGLDVALMPQKEGLLGERVRVNPVELARVLGIPESQLPEIKPPAKKAGEEDDEDSPPVAPAWTIADYFSLEKWGEVKWPWQKLENVDENVADEVMEGAAAAAAKHANVKKHTQLAEIYIWRSVDDDPRVQTKGLAAQESFMIYIKASFVVGVLVASPWIFWQVWSFIAAGLYPHEKKYVHIFLPFSLGLFLGGAALAFFFVFQPVLEFLFSFNEWMKIEPDPRISEWLNFFLILPLGFGISFQLPLVMLFLDRIGIMSAAAYASHWKIAILVIFTISMFLTPADPTSLILMAVPLCILYVGGIALCKLMPRIRSPYYEMDN